MDVSKQINKMLGEEKQTNNNNKINKLLGQEDNIDDTEDEKEKCSFCGCSVHIKDKFCSGCGKVLK